MDWIKYLSSIELEFHFPCNVQSVLANISVKRAIEARSKTTFVSNLVARQVDLYDPPGYSQDIKALYLKMYLNGMGFRGISRVTGVAHTTY